MADQLYPPFASIPLPKYMRNEIERRSDKYGNNYVKDFSNIKDYRGGSTTWIRLVSNSVNSKYRGFVMYGGETFSDKYGIQNTVDNKSNATIIGYDKLGNPHYIENSIESEFQKHRPIPGIVSVDVDIQREIIRKATIKWKCFSVSQINYMTPYFFAPYNTLLLEWGWNTYNPESLIEIQYIGSESKKDQSGKQIDPGSGILGAYTNAELIEKNLEISEGKYDAMIGHITNFDYSFDSSDMSFNCVTEIYSNSKFYYGLSMMDTSPENKSDEPLNDKQKRSIAELMTSDISSYLKKLCNEAYTYYFYSQFEKYKGTTFPTTEDNQKYSDIFDAVIWRASSKTAGKSPTNHGGLFSLNNYSNIVTKESINRYKESSGFYITIGLFVDILNIIIPNTANNAKINLNECKIGAHPNLISPTVNYLIPNNNAPYFTSENLNGFPSKNSKNPNNSTPEDMLLYNVLNTNERQDLDSIINWIRYKMIPDKSYSFPIKGNDNKFTGNLKDLYIKYDYALELLKDTRNIKEFLQNLCNSLNNLGKIWNLKIIENEPGNISIRDERLLDINHIKNLKSQLKLTDEDPVVYPFDVYSQNSIIRDFSFNVKMSDKVASMILYDTTAASSNKKDTTQTATGQSYVAKFGVATDEILSSINYKPQESTGTTPIKDSSYNLLYRDGLTVKKISIFSIKKDGDKFYVEEVKDGKKIKTDVTKYVEEQKKTELIKNIKYQNIDEQSLWLYVPDFRVKDADKKIVRLVLPSTSESLLVQLISDDNPLFTNISTMPMPGVTVEFSLLGISGFRSFQIFTAKNLPQPYDKGVIFQVRDVKHSINKDGWITSITSTVRPSFAIDGLLGIK